MPDHLRRLGAPSPPPLRSSLLPRGLPELSALNQARVDSANAISDYVCAICTASHHLGAGWSVENPTRSYMWQIDTFVSLAQLPGAYFVEYDGCMMGGTRPKASSWLTNVPQLNRLSGKCDMRHQHEPWSIDRTTAGWSFSTATEAAYPTVLCNAAAAAVVDFICTKGFVAKPLSLQEPNTEPLSTRQRMGAYAGKQPRGRRVPEVVPEHKSCVTVQSSAAHWNACPRDASKLLAQ